MHGVSYDLASVSFSRTPTYGNLVWMEDVEALYHCSVTVAL